MQLKWKRVSLSVVLVLGLWLCLQKPLYAKTSVKNYTFTVKPGSMGEYNITLTSGKMSSKPQVYYKNWQGKQKQLQSGVRCVKTSSGYKLECSLEKKTYYVKVKGTAKPTCRLKKNLDRYASKQTGKMGRGVSWKPKENSYQPYLMSGTCIRQIAYLTREEAVIYAMNLDKNLYLRVLDTSVRATALIAAAGLKETSALGRAIMSISRSKLADVAKTLVTGLGGISLVPDIKAVVLEDVVKKTKNYTTGLKITVTDTVRGGCVNSYESWDGKASSVYGKEYCRGNFSTLKKVEGWY